MSTHVCQPNSFGACDGCGTALFKRKFYTKQELSDLVATGVKEAMKKPVKSANITPTETNQKE